ncbi:MAG: PDZ domain-containing protein [Bdellovibrionales bacterium]|nr:PDZ domain-containing protein [Bdellovibrionales bacterium]
MRLKLFILICFIGGSLKAQDRSSEITCEPHWQDKKIVGFTCPQLHEQSLLKRMGIEPNDVILEYNGKIIDSFADMQKFYEQLHVKGKMHVKYIRENKLQEVTNVN